LSSTSLTRSKITLAKLLARQFGLQREATGAPPSSATLQCGGPLTASIPKTRDQPEETSSKRSPPCGNNASTEISPGPPARRRMPGPPSHRQNAPHSGPVTTGSAYTNNPNGVQAGRPRPADSTPQSSNRGAQNMRSHSTRWQDTAQSGSFRSRAGDGAVGLGFQDAAELGERIQESRVGAHPVGCPSWARRSANMRRSQSAVSRRSAI